MIRPVLCFAMLTSISSLGGCWTVTRAIDHCGGIRAGWSSDPQKLSYELISFHNLHVRADGALLWNRKPISEAKLTAYAGLLHQLTPQPWIWLTYDASTNCNTVDQIRDLLERQTCPDGECQGHFNLAEPILKAP